MADKKYKITFELSDGTEKSVEFTVWSQADKESIVQDVLAALGTPVFGRVDAENNIVLTGELADGTYTLKYEYEDGSVTEIGTLTHNSDSGYINLADPTSEDWMDGYRINSSGSLVEASVTYVTNFIPCRNGDLIRIKGMAIGRANGNGLRVNAYFYGEDKTTVVAKIQTYTENYVPAEGFTEDQENAFWTHTVGASPYTIMTGDVSDIRYCRFSGELYSGYTENDVIITVNQEIT